MGALPGGGRVALVTGGTRGIGLGIARALAAEGWNLVLCGRRAEAEVGPVLEGLARSGAEAGYVRADIGEDAAPELILAAVRERFGRLDALVNNAGVAPRERADIMDASRESFDSLIRTNLRGPYFLTQAAARWMLAQRRGVGQAEGEAARAGGIVFVTSISAVVASINRGEYCLSKAALSMASSLWATRLAEEGIPVFELRPGIIRTDMTAAVAATYDAKIAGGLTLQRRWGLPEDVGKAAAMLLRGDLPYSTGQVITIDGGLTLQRL
jgi:3-oxoacyl-[acyl-carrier protein] reductase